MKQSIKIIIYILCIGLIFISTNVYATTGKTVNTSTRIRKEASTSSEVVDSLSQGVEVEILSEEGEWYKVTYNGATGYIRKDLLSVEEDASSENTTDDTTTENTSSETENTSNETVENTTTNSTENSESSNENTDSDENADSTVQEENTESTETENNSLQAGYTGKILSAVDVKILPSINSSVIGKINENTEISVKEIINKWCYIETNEISGWALLSKVKTDATVSAQNTTGETSEENNTQTGEENTTGNEQTSSTVKYVSTETLNVREKPENNANIVKQLSLNDEVTVLEEVDSTWSKITFKNTTGYVANQFLSNTKASISSRSETITRENSKIDTVNQANEETNNTEPLSSSKSSSNVSTSGTTGNNIVSFAKQYLGYKYVSGGASPSSGFDCSGLTYYVYKNFGITLNRSSSAQISNGVEVSKAELQPGDLVLFNNSSNSKIGHVGIYIGSNTFLHAANAKKGVITTSLSDSYYSARYAGARRVIN